MGAVHAKAPESPNKGDVGGGLFEFEEPIHLDDNSLPKPQIKLDGVRARVDRVHVDGLNRTKDDIVRNTVDELFHATDFEDVIIKAHKVRQALESMGCFREIGVLIDVSSGPNATPEGLEVTFQVKEQSRVVGGVNTTISENEGNLVLGVKMPNVLGRGERLQAEYSMGHRSSSNFSVAATKPFPHKPLVPVFTTTVYQQNQEYPWSGYRLLDRGLLLDLAFKTSPTTQHNLQWEGLVRDTAVLTKTTSFKVRESCGPQLKSVVRHCVCVDGRDEAVFPSRGSRVRFSSELAGLGGGVAYIKTDLQAEGNYTVYEDFVIQGTAAAGVLHDVFGSSLADRFFLGGPASVRGYQQRGIGPHVDGLAVGGKMYWAGGLHLFAPLPFTSARSGISSLFRSHLFINAGSLGDGEEGWWRAGRVSAGVGVALRVGAVGRAELNYCLPAPRPGDRPHPAVQLALAAHFL